MSSSTAAPQSAFSSGAITGFGSVIVNGVHFDDNGADITMDDQMDDNKGVKDDLRVGMVVEIEGTNNGDGTGKASSIRFQNLVRGPVDSMSGSTLMVMGQPVLVTPATVFDDVADLGSITPGNIVAVSGFFDSLDPTKTNNIVARRIEKKPAGFLQSSGVLKVMGFVKNLTMGATTFTINNLTVNYNNAQIEGATAATLKDGMFVDVRAHTAPAPGGMLAAEKVKVKSPKPTPAEGARAEVEGIVTSCIGDAFVIGGITVEARSAGMTCTSALVGTKLEVEGVITNGMLVVGAGKVEKEHDEDANITIEALAQAMDGTANTVTVLGQQIKVTSATQFEGMDDQTDHFFSLNKIHQGDALQIRAFQDTSGALVALRVERLSQLSSVAVQGPMGATDPMTMSFTIAGIKVQGGPKTQWRNNTGPVDANTWFATTALNTVVKGNGVADMDGKSVDVTAGEVQAGD